MINRIKMTRSSECTKNHVQTALDSADIVREGFIASNALKLALSR
jgi:hypothetical protein